MVKSAQEVGDFLVRRLVRAAVSSLDKLAEKSISGHMSDKMDFVCGTALYTEKRDALESVVRALGVRPLNDPKRPTAE